MKNWQWILLGVICFSVFAILALPIVTKKSGIDIIQSFLDDNTDKNTFVGDWWDNDWDYYKVITIESDYIDSDLTYFPVLVNSTDTAMIAKCQSNGEDIRFLSTDDVTEFYYEIEEWNPGGFSIWVNISETLTSDSDYQFLMYYGNDAVSDNQNAIGVWDSNYSAVWHLNQLGTGSNWTRDSNPIYSPNTDDLTPTIVKDITGTGIHLYHNIDTSIARDIYHAWSPDINGTFTYDEKVLDIGGGGDWDERCLGDTAILKYINNGTAIKKDGTYWMFYHGVDSSNNDAIGFAQTTDLNNTWIRNTTYSPCVGLGENATGWDDNYIAYLRGLVVWEEDGIYKMLYGAYNTTSDKSGICYATSTNLTHWTKYKENPVLLPTIPWETSLIKSPDIWKTGDTYIVMYSGTDNADLENLGLATGTDVTSLIKSSNNPIASYVDSWENSGISDFQLFRDADTDYIIYEGESNNVYAIGRMWCENITVATEESLTIYDSTSNDNDGTTSGTINYQQTGKIGYGIDLPGTSDYFTVVRDDSIEPQTLTLEGWINADSYKNCGIFSKENTDHSDPYYSYMLNLRDPADNDFFNIVVPAAYADRNEITTVATYTTGTWTYVVLSFDGTILNFYKDASTHESNSKAITIAYHATDLYIGDRRNLDYDFDGKMDELRISDTCRNWSWINASFHTMNQTIGFMVFGNEQLQLAELELTYWISGGNVSVNELDLSYWVSGGNVSAYELDLSYWVSGGNVSAYELDLSYWVSGGNVSAYELDLSYWVSGGNVSAYELDLSYWISGGNETPLPAELELSYWISGGNVSINELDLSYWISGGNETPLPAELELTYWISGGNISALPPELTGIYPANESTGIDVPVSFGVNITDVEGENITINLYSNRSGSWVIFATFTNVTNGSYYFIAVEFNLYNTTYYWFVNLTDESNLNYESSNFSFTTAVFALAPIRIYVLPIADYSGLLLAAAFFIILLVGAAWYRSNKKRQRPPPILPNGYPPQF